MKNNSKNLGLVTKKFNDFFLVDLKNQEKLGNSEKFLCKVRKSINFKDQLIYVGDEVVINNIDLKNQENFGKSDRILCKVRKSINFKDQLIYVGDEVVIDNIDLKVSVQ